jgi:hypothetical protein
MSKMRRFATFRRPHCLQGGGIELAAPAIPLLAGGGIELAAPAIPLLAGGGIELAAPVAPLCIKLIGRDFLAI